MNKQETIEELAEKYYPAYPDGIVTSEIYSLREGFIKGAKWQQEQDLLKHENEKEEDVFKSIRKIYEKLLSKKYSEEEVLEIMRKSRYAEFGIHDLKKWFEQFKK